MKSWFRRREPEPEPAAAPAPAPPPLPPAAVPEPQLREWSVGPWSWRAWMDAGEVPAAAGGLAEVPVRRYLETLRPGDRVLHLGAGDGWLAAGAAAVVGAAGLVVAVEVANRHVLRLHAQAGANSFSHLRTQAFAAALTRGELSWRPAGDGEIELLAPGTPGATPCTARAADELLEQHGRFTFLRVAVGALAATVLRGCPHVIQGVSRLCLALPGEAALAARGTGVEEIGRLVGAHRRAGVVVSRREGWTRPWPGAEVDWTGPVEWHLSGPEGRA